MKLIFSAACLLATAFAASFTEDFSGDWESRWVQSKHKSDYGKFVATSGKWHADKEQGRGLQTSEDAKFYAIASKFPAPIDGTKDKLVVALSVKHEQNIDCGGGYVKVMSSDADISNFHGGEGETQYAVMFGPDICGSTKKVQMIFHYKGENLLWKKTLRAESDDLTHTYMMVVDFAAQTYEVLVDGDVKESGKLEEDWSFLAPREIDDPEDHKPSDWVDQAQIDDPEDVKPEGYDDIPETIADPDAKRPDDWDEEEDGKWEAPTIPNPEFKGPWHAKKIPNPAYKGVWSAKRIPNPAFVEDKELAKYPDLGAIGIDIWQVKSGTIFDNIFVGSDAQEAKDFLAARFGKEAVEAEKASRDKYTADKAKAEESSKKSDEAADAPAADEDEEL